MIIFILSLAISQTSTSEISSSKLHVDLNCTDIEVNEHQKISDSTSFFIGTNNLDELKNQKIPTLDYNLIEIESRFQQLPSDVQLQSMFYIDFFQDQDDELCSLYLNQTIQTYFIQCIIGITVDNQVKMKKDQKRLISIPSALYGKCSQFSFLMQQFFILCQQAQNYHIVNLDKETGKLLEIFDLNITSNQFTECSIKYKPINFEIKQIFKAKLQEKLYIALFCCEDWQIFSLNRNKEKQSIFNKQHSIFLDNIDIDTKSLINVQIQQHEIQMIFKNGICNIQDLQQGSIFWRTFSEDYSVQDICSDTVNNHNDFDIIKRIHSQKKQLMQENLQQVYYFQDSSFIALYYQRLEYIHNSYYNQSVNVELKQIITLNKRSNYFFGIDQQNSIFIFKITPLHQYYPYGHQHKYIVQYKIQQLTPSIIVKNCYYINQLNEEQKQFSLQIIEDYRAYSQNDPTQLTITFEKQNYIKCNVPYKISMNDGSVISNQEMFRSTCNYKQYFQTAQRYFFVRDPFRIDLIIFEGHNNTLVVFNCKTNSFRVYQINFSSKVESVFFNDVLFVLDSQGTSLYGLDFEDQKNEFVLIYKFDSQMSFLKQKESSFYRTVSLLKKQIYSEIVVVELFVELGKMINPRYNEQILYLPNQENKIIKKVIKFNHNVYFISTSQSIIFMINQQIQQVLHESLELLDASCDFYLQYYVCEIVGLSSNKMKKYLISENEHTLLSELIFEEYIPVHPIQYATIKTFEGDKILIAAKRLSDDSKFLLLLNNVEVRIYLEQIIQCGNYYFRLSRDHVMYYDVNFELMSLTYNQYKIQVLNREQKHFNEKITLPFQFTQLQGNLTVIKQNISFYITKSSDVLLMKTNINNDLHLSGGSVKLNIRDFFIGNIENITIVEPSEFIIQSPLRYLDYIYCGKLMNFYCVNFTAPQIIFYNVLTSSKVNYITSDQTFIHLFYFHQIIEYEQYLMITFDDFLSYNLTILQSVNNQLQARNQYALPNQIYKIFVVQNIFMLVFKNFTRFYLVTKENMLIDILTQDSQCTQLSFIKDNIYTQTIFNSYSIIFKSFKIQGQLLIDIQTFNITQEILQLYVNNKFQYPQIIDFQSIKVENMTISSDEKILLTELYIFDKFKYIYWVNLQLNLTDATYQLIVNNIFDNMQFHSNNNAVTKVCGNLLLVSASTFKIFQLELGDDFIQPIYQKKKFAGDIFSFNTTHFAISNQIKNNYYFLIVSIQQWELYLIDNIKRKEHYEVKIQASNSLYQSNWLTIRITDKKNPKKFDILYLVLIASNLLLIIIFIRFHKRRVVGLKTIRQVKIVQNSL